MARTVRNAKIDTPSARARLAKRREPYWAVLLKGRALGYRKGGKGGTWIARFRGVNGKQHYQSLGPADDALDVTEGDVLDYERAETAARAWFTEMVKRNGDDENGHDGPYTVADAAREYLVSARENARAPKEIEYNINAFILPHLAEVEVKKLTKRRIEKWHREIAKTPARLRTRLGGEQLYRPLDTEDEEAVRKRRVTANKKLTTLKAALNYAWREGRVADREAWMRVQPFKGVDAPRAEYLETDEAVRLINASEDEFRPLVHAALLTGARYGELGALDVRDYSDNAQTVHVRRSKSGKPRDVHLNDEGVAFFRAQTTGRQKRDPMFPRHDGKRWGKSQQARFMTETCQRAEVTVMGFHQLRHTYASHAIMNGAPLGVVAKNLGHADTRMVEKHYGHLADRYMAETIRATAPRLNVETKTNLEKLRPKEKAVESG